MERQTMIERSFNAIGQPYTQELHDAWVKHVAAVEEAYQKLILRDRIAIRERVRTAVAEAVRP